MPNMLPDSLLSRTSELLAARIGLHFPPPRWNDLERGLSAAARAADTGLEVYVHQLLAAPPDDRQIASLAPHLTVGETYFFRDGKSFEAIGQNVLTELIRTRQDAGRHLRIWSAGCSTGEEPYSLAMLLDRLLPAREQWNITILATDLNPLALQKAAAGLYGEWSFRDAPPWVKERYFTTKRDGRFELHPRIRKMVTFARLNLAEDSYPASASNTLAMDLILCRNVLMYFTPELAGRIVGKLRNALVDGGWLAVSPAETLNIPYPGFSLIEFPGALLYRKTAAEAPPALLPPPPEQAYFPPVEPDWLPEANLEPPLPEVAPPPEASPSSTDLLLRARNSADQGRLTEAIEWCERAIALDKLNPHSHYLLATIRQELGQGRAAEQSLKCVLYLAHDFAPAHFALGNLRLSQGRFGEAKRHFTHTLELLQASPHDLPLPEMEGLTAGRLAEIVRAVKSNLPHLETNT